MEISARILNVWMSFWTSWLLERHAHITTLFEGGNKNRSKAENYRPISQHPLLVNLWNIIQSHYASFQFLNTIKSKGDITTMQNDTDQTVNWEKLWSMEFHPDKCFLLQITNKNINTCKETITIHSHTELEDSAKYLGATISKDWCYTIST